MMFHLNIKDEDGSSFEMDVRLPGCFKPGDVFQHLDNLYKVTELDRREHKGNAIFCRKVKQDSFKSRR